MKLNNIEDVIVYLESLRNRTFDERREMTIKIDIIESLLDKLRNSE